MITPHAVWGWPWHGLISAGMVGSRAHAQPDHCNSWLIDAGLPAISLDTDQAADTAARGWEWRNYALLPGGYCHGTYLGDNAYIHMDAAGVPWHITLIDAATVAPAWVTATAYAVNDFVLHGGEVYVCLIAHTSDVLSADLAAGRMGAVDVAVAVRIVRFGLFGEGAHAPATRLIAVACHEIALSNPVGVYASRRLDLLDVWTNGSKALLGVMLITGASPPLHDLFSVIEITISGAGGTNGAGLVVTASEIIGQPDLTTGDTNNSNGHGDPIDTGDTNNFGYLMTYQHICTDGNPATVGARWEYVGGAVPSPIVWRTDTGFGGGYPVVQDYYWGWQYARTAFYDHAGAPKALVFEARRLRDHWITSTSGPSASGVDELFCNGAYAYGARVDWYVAIAGVNEFSARIRHGATIIDEIATVQEFVGQQHHYEDSGINAGVISTYNATGPIAWRGGLSIPEAPVGFNDEALVLAFRAAWRSTDPHKASAEVTYGSTTLGIQRIDAKAAGFYVVSAGQRVYGTIGTPLGNQTIPGPVSGNQFFAWQRKTGASGFFAAASAYV